MDKLTLDVHEKGVFFEREGCLINLPVRNINMVAKNKDKLMLLVGDPDRVVEEEWIEEEE